MSWMTVRHLGTELGTIESASGKLWGYARVAIEYRAGGYCEALVPMWLAGQLMMSRLVKGKSGLVTMSSRAYNTSWKRGLGEGWVKIVSRTTAAEDRAYELYQEAKDTDPMSWQIADAAESWPPLNSPSCSY